MYYCYYSAVRKGTGKFERSSNTSCYAQWVHNLSALDRVVVHLALTDPKTGVNILKYTKREVFRYLRALQSAGFSFKFSANNQMPKIQVDCYGNPLLPANMERDTICYDIYIDLTKCSHMNAQIVMFCVRFLHEKPIISDTFLRFLEDDRKAKVKSGIHLFDKMLIAMQASPGSGHSFGSYGYNLLLGKEGFEKHITNNPKINSITSAQLPSINRNISYYNPELINLRRMIADGEIPFQEVVKLYKEQCAKYT